ncbi:hypothetical protein JJV70_02665 [Streptomyces sp. JJ66]|uniref:hypothetical protein n=1 Tax=Streptomyces sp. JJ66 TaxID=2803843 RepID=UPI001C56D3D4|nr:hypothetical protein [Streptomyces sp. JJ66]MBW1601022.1 hypothetical protein [Streptomyces sp. JJ66]
MIPAIASRIPLVKRSKAPALPLDERITHLTGLTVAPAGAGHRDLVARACGVLNYGALIVSDVGMPGLAAELCWRQHRVFADARHLPGDVAVMSLMPLINISRLLIRNGDGHTAYDVLTRLYRAAQQRATTVIDGNTIDLSALIRTEADHRRICQELWVTLLVDGARALARIGRWTEAADAMTAHRGIGNRLLDGRQIMIMSLLERGLDQQARDAIDSAVPTEPWENAIAALLRICCRSEGAPAPELDRAVQEALTLLTPPESSTAAFQTRVGLAALDLTCGQADACLASLCDALADAARLDAYAAREVLAHHTARSHLTSEQRQRLRAAVTASGLGVGGLPQAHMQVVSEGVDKAEVALRELLEPPLADGLG